MTYQSIFDDAIKVFQTSFQFQPERQWVLKQLPKLLETIYKLKIKEAFSFSDYADPFHKEHDNALAEIMTFMPYLTASFGLLTMTLELKDGTVVEPSKEWMASSQNESIDIKKIPFVYHNNQPYYDNEVYVIFRRNSNV